MRDMKPSSHCRCLFCHLQPNAHIDRLNWLVFARMCSGRIKFHHFLAMCDVQRFYHFPSAIIRSRFPLYVSIQVYCEASSNFVNIANDGRSLWKAISSVRNIYWKWKISSASAWDFQWISHKNCYQYLVLMAFKNECSLIRTLFALCLARSSGI